MKVNKYTLILRILLPVPFIIGIIGYKMAGFDNGDSFYGSFCYYFVSVYKDKAYNPVMEIARWTAPLMTVTWLFYSLRGLLTTAKNYWLSKRRDAVVIYYDDNLEEAKLLVADIPRSFTVEMSDRRMGVFFPKVKNQILLFKDDIKNLDFYGKHDSVLNRRNVYMKIEEIDTIILNKSDIQFFNVNENIGASFWNEHPILLDAKADQREIHIAIIGNTELAEKILIQALWLNIFYEDQHIVYHIYGDWVGRRAMLAEIDTMNGDEIILEDRQWYDSLNELSSMDRIIVATEYQNDIIEDLIYMCPNVQVYYYSKAGEDLAKFFRAENIHDFGSREKLLTKANIMGDVTYRLAKELNYLVRDHEANLSRADMERYKEQEWRKLDGETQLAFQSIANYFYLYGKLQAMGYELADNAFDIVRYEHTRLCRFSYVSNWSYGIPEDGKLIDPEKKINKALVPYDELNLDDEAVLLQRVVFLVHQFKDMFKDNATEE